MVDNVGSATKVSGVNGILVPMINGLFKQNRTEQQKVSGFLQEYKTIIKRGKEGSRANALECSSTVLFSLQLFQHLQGLMVEIKIDPIYVPTHSCLQNCLQEDEDQNKLIFFAYMMKIMVVPHYYQDE